MSQQCQFSVNTITLNNGVIPPNNNIIFDIQSEKTPWTLFCGGQKVASSSDKHWLPIRMPPHQLQHCELHTEEKTPFPNDEKVTFHTLDLPRHLQDSLENYPQRGVLDINTSCAISKCFDPTVDCPWVGPDTHTYGTQK